MIRIAVVDDEQFFLDNVEQISHDYFNNINEPYEVVVYNHSGNLLWDLEDDVYYDLYLLDVQMPGIGGLELAQKIRLLYDEPYIVFVTSYEEYCRHGYKYNAYSYILKNEMDQELPRVLDELGRLLIKQQEKQLIIEKYSQICKVNYKDIYYLHIDDKYTEIITQLKKYSVRRSLKNVYEELSENSKEFIYADKAYVVNIRHILELGKERTLIMRDKSEITVSEPQLQKVKKAINAYWLRKL